MLPETPTKEFWLNRAKLVTALVVLLTAALLLWFLDRRDASEAAPEADTAGAVVTEQDGGSAARAFEMVRVFGSVVDERDQGLAADIFLKQHGFAFRLAARAQSDGSFSFETTPGQALLYGVGQRGLSTPSQHTFMRLEIPGVEPSYGPLRIRLLDQMETGFLVRDARDQSPIADALLVFGEALTLEARTDTAGRVSRSLTPELWQVAVSAEGYRDRVLSINAAQPQQEWLIEMEAEASFGVSIFDQYDAPVAGASLVFSDQREPYTSDLDGVVSRDDMPVGPVPYSVRKPGFAPLTPEPAVAGAFRELVMQRLPSSLVRIHGKVRDRNKNPLADCQVEINGRMVRTGSDGAFAFDDVRMGHDAPLAVSFRHPQKSPRVMRIAHQEQVADYPLLVTLDAFHPLKGRVTDTTGNGVPGALIQYRGQENRVVVDEQALFGDGEGRFEIDTPAPHSLLTIKAEGFYSLAAEWWPEDDQNDPTFVLEAEPSINLTVTDEAGNPITRYRATLTGAEVSDLLSLRAEAGASGLLVQHQDGVVELPKSATNTRVWLIEAPGYLPKAFHQYNSEPEQTLTLTDLPTSVEIHMGPTRNMDFPIASGEVHFFAFADTVYDFDWTGFLAGEMPKDALWRKTHRFSTAEAVKGFSVAGMPKDQVLVAILDVPNSAFAMLESELEWGAISGPFNSKDQPESSGTTSMIDTYMNMRKSMREQGLSEYLPDDVDPRITTLSEETGEERQQASPQGFSLPGRFIFYLIPEARLDITIDESIKDWYRMTLSAAHPLDHTRVVLSGGDRHSFKRLPGGFYTLKLEHGDQRTSTWTINVKPGEQHSLLLEDRENHRFEVLVDQERAPGYQLMVKIDDDFATHTVDAQSIAGFSRLPEQVILLGPPGVAPNWNKATQSGFPNRIYIDREQEPPATLHFTRLGDLTARVADETVHWSVGLMGSTSKGRYSDIIQPDHLGYVHFTQVPPGTYDLIYGTAGNFSLLKASIVMPPGEDLDLGDILREDPGELELVTQPLGDCYMVVNVVNVQTGHTHYSGTWEDLSAPFHLPEIKPGNYHVTFQSVLCAQSIYPINVVVHPNQITRREVVFSDAPYVEIRIPGSEITAIQVKAKQTDLTIHGVPGDLNQPRHGVLTFSGPHALIVGLPRGEYTAEITPLQGKIYQSEFVVGTQSILIRAW